MSKTKSFEMHITQEQVHENNTAQSRDSSAYLLCFLLEVITVAIK